MTERYQVVRKFKTRTGVRHEATDLTDGKTVLLQCIPENPQTRILDHDTFVVASQVLPKIRHRNLVPILDMALTDNGAVIASPNEKIETLTDWLIGKGTLQLVEFISVASDCLNGLLALESAGLAHGAVEPDRIALKLDAKARLCAILVDGGLSQLSKPATGSRPENSFSGRMLEFVSPEEFRGQASTPQSDLYALGCTLYYSFSGVAPFSGRTPTAIMEAHLASQPFSILDRRPMPEPLAQWLTWMIALKPPHRPLTVAHAIELLQSAIGESFPEMAIDAMVPASEFEIAPTAISQSPAPAAPAPREPVASNAPTQPQAVPLRVAAPASVPARPAAPKVVARPSAPQPATPSAVPRAVPRVAATPAAQHAVPRAVPTARPVAPSVTPRAIPRTTPNPLSSPQAVPRAVAKPGTPVPTPRAVPRSPEAGK